MIKVHEWGTPAMLGDVAPGTCVSFQSAIDGTLLHGLLTSLPGMVAFFSPGALSKTQMDQRVLALPEAKAVYDLASLRTGLFNEPTPGTLCISESSKWFYVRDVDGDLRFIGIETGNVDSDIGPLGQNRLSFTKWRIMVPDAAGDQELCPITAQSK